MRRSKKIWIAGLLAFLFVLAPFNDTGSVLPAAAVLQADTPYMTETELSLERGSTKSLKLKNADLKPVWKSSNQSVAKVSKSGKVTAIKDGVAVIVAIYEEEVYTCIVTVGEIKRKELTPAEVYELCSGSVVEIHVKTKDGGNSTGSGFFIGEGKLLTNYHVIKGAVSIQVLDYAGKEFKVTSIYDYDKEIDIALLGVKGGNQPLVLADRAVKTGEDVYAIGSPFGYTGTLSKGIVSLAERSMDGLTYIQLTAPISKGNSGGPLLNCYGEVIGVNTASRIEGQNINFALGTDYIDKLNQNDAKAISTFYQLK